MCKHRTTQISLYTLTFSLYLYCYIEKSCAMQLYGFFCVAYKARPKLFQDNTIIDNVLSTPATENNNRLIYSLK